LFKITKAPITPGIHPQSVNNRIIKKEPQPLSITDNGGNKMANKTRRKLIAKHWLVYLKDEKTIYLLHKNPVTIELSSIVTGLNYFLFFSFSYI
jgi:hypothetical protein